MRLAGIHSGDIVAADIKGRRFLAIVTARHNGRLAIEPLQAHVTYRTLTSRQVTAHWARRGRARSRDGDERP